MAAVQARPNVLAQYAYLADLRNTKGGLFFAAMQQHPEALLPIVYTPGVGDACLNWGLLPSRPRALVLSLQDRGNITKKLKEFKNDASVVVVTDGPLLPLVSLNSALCLYLWLAQHKVFQSFLPSCTVHGADLITTA
jgi:hypothetical protein